MAHKKQVVIVGGGGAGTQVARSLSGQLDSTQYQITLISAHPYSIFYVASLRMLVTDEGSLENQILLPYDKLFIGGNGTFKRGTVKAIEAQKGSKSGGKVILEDGQSVKYDILVLAPGSKWEGLLDFPLGEQNVQEHIQGWRNKFRSAKSITIGGGGAVGIELAGEIRHYYPNTRVTIVHGDKHLLNKAYPDKFRHNVEKRIRSRGVDVILDDYIDSLDESTTRKGVQLDTDLVVFARGARPNTSWIAPSLGEDVVTKQGFIRVKPTLQVDGYANIFAVGDAIDFPEQKQLGKYAAHTEVVTANISSFVKNKQPSKEYKGQSEMILVTMGKSGGTGLLFGMTVGDWVTSLIKAKGLLISMYRKNMGQSA